MMKQRMTTEKRGRLLSIINNETDRLARLINDILDLTKIEAGKLSWHISRVSLPEIIHNSVTNIQSLADNKSLAISTRVPDSLPASTGTETAWCRSSPIFCPMPSNSRPTAERSRSMPSPNWTIDTRSSCR